MDPQNLRYRESHEWAGLEGDLCTVGITQFAADQLTDIVYVDIQVSPGDDIEQGDVMGEIESVKAVSDLYSPVAGEVVEVNKKLQTDASPISNDPFGEGWLIKIRVSDTNLDHLKNREQYQKQIESEAH